MFQINFTLNQPSSEVTILKLPIWFRFFFSGIAAFIAFAVFSEPVPGQSNIGPIIIISGCLLAASYYEAWLFNKDKKSIERRFGLFFFYSTKSMDMEQLDHIHMVAPPFDKSEMDHIPNRKKVKWKRRQYAKLYLVFKDDTTATIEMLPAKQTAIIENNAQHLSTFCDCQLHKSNPYETNESA